MQTKPSQYKTVRWLVYHSQRKQQAPTCLRGRPCRRPVRPAAALARRAPVPDSIAERWRQRESRTMRGSCNGRLNVRHNDAAVVVVLARCRCSSAEVKMVGGRSTFFRPIRTALADAISGTTSHGSQDYRIVYPNICICKQARTDNMANMRASLSSNCRSVITPVRLAPTRTFFAENKNPAHTSIRCFSERVRQSKAVSHLPPQSLILELPHPLPSLSVGTSPPIGREDLVIRKQRSYRQQIAGKRKKKEQPV